MQTLVFLAFAAYKRPGKDAFRYKQSTSSLLMQTLVFPAFPPYKKPKKRCPLLYMNKVLKLLKRLFQRRCSVKISRKTYKQ
jgi:hypothetical protein